MVEVERWECRPCLTRKKAKINKKDILADRRLAVNSPFHSMLVSDLGVPPSLIICSNKFPCSKSIDPVKCPDLHPAVSDKL